MKHWLLSWHIPVLLLSTALYSGNALSIALNHRPAALSFSRDSFPAPKTPDLLFYLQRSTNTNTVVYELNKNKAGKLDHKNPIRISWISYAEDGKRDKLTAVQKKLAYGLKYSKIDGDSWEFHFVSLPAQAFQLQKTAEGNYQVLTRIQEQQAQLKRVFLQIDGGTFLNPNVSYAQLEGKSLKSGEPISQRLDP